MADGDDEMLTPAREQISSESMRQKIENLGYDVRQLEREDGNFEAFLVEKKSGARVKAVFAGTTGDLVRAEPHE